MQIHLNFILLTLVTGRLVFFNPVLRQKNLFLNFVVFWLTWSHILNFTFWQNI